MEFEAQAPDAERLLPRCPCRLGTGPTALTVVLCREVFEGREAVVARHVLLELLLQRLETDAVLLVGAELGDVEAGRVRHVDHVGVGQHRELVLLRDKDMAVRGSQPPARHLPCTSTAKRAPACNGVVCVSGTTNPSGISNKLPFFFQVAFSWFLRDLLSLFVKKRHRY